MGHIRKLALMVLTLAVSAISLSTTPVATAAVARISVVPGPNQLVQAISIPDSVGTRYLAGLFTAFDSWGTGSGALVDNQTGTVNTSFPAVTAGGANSVLASAADGSGGFYIGGIFTTVGGVARNNLAHISSDGTVTAWNPIINGYVNAIAVSGDTVYIGGIIQSIGGVARNTGVVAVDSTTGTTTNWNPTVSNQVKAIAVSGNTVYIGGDFTTVGGVTRNGAAAINTDGTLTNWNPNIIGNVYAIAVSGNTVYLGGNFTTVGGERRSRIAAVNTDGTLTSWNPEANAYVSTIAVSGNTVYIGGDFTTVGGEIRSGLAAVNNTTGAIVSLQLPPAAPATPVATALDGKVSVAVSKGSTPAGTPSSFTVSAVQDGTKTCTVSGASGSCTVESLTNGISYTFVATASNAGGPSGMSVASNAVTPAAVPTTTVPLVVTTTTVPKVMTPSVKKGKKILFSTIYKSAKIWVPSGAKVVLTVASSSKKICSASKTTVKALAIGTCSLSVAMTPRATAKVKKPKTVVIKTKVIVTK